MNIKFRRIPPGKFVMGVHEEEANLVGAYPSLQCEITYPFRMSTCEITQAQFQDVMGENPSKFNKNYLLQTNGQGAPDAWRHRPVDSVSWQMAFNFCVELTKSAQKNGVIASNEVFRLPTELEWEYVCRAGNNSDTSDTWGESYIKKHAWSWLDGPSIVDDRQTSVVGKKEPNAWGFYDMLGNVEEACLDGYWYYGDVEQETLTNWAALSKLKGDRMFRGGNFMVENSDYVNPYQRGSESRYSSQSHLGFRIVLSSFETDEDGFYQQFVDYEPDEPIRIPELALDMVPIQKGSFTMGESSPDSPRGPSVYPPTNVTIQKRFLISRTEISRFQWEQYEKDNFEWMVNNSKDFDIFKIKKNHDKNDLLPATQISWQEARDFCAALTVAFEKKGLLDREYVIRLPTEAEWEWACRRDHESLYHYGETYDALSDFSGKAFHLNNSNGQPGSIIEKEGGLDGLIGLYGNVREWCLDSEYTYPGSGKPLMDPIGTPEQSQTKHKVVRGGDFLSKPEMCSGTARAFFPAETKSDTIGFRIVIGPRDVSDKLNAASH